MAKPTTRTEFKNYCLRKLGFPVHGVSVDDDQVEDRIDEALSYFVDYHMDATDRIYVKHQITQQDRDNGYITLPDNIIGTVQVFPISSLGSYGTDMFNVRYQIALNELYTLTSVSMVPFMLAMQHLNLISEMLIGIHPIRYTRHKNRVYIDMTWSRAIVGQYLILECFEVVDPTQFTEVWSDRWLQNYATAKIKAQWGENIGLYDGVLPGGMKLNYQRIIDEANRDIEKLEQEMMSSYSIPPADWLG